MVSSELVVDLLYGKTLAAGEAVASATAGRRRIGAAG
jgi:hypothetical protein